ncbi:TolC family outer membrane protein [Pseudomonas paraeruginosa]|uniref:TolC family outer membrane protein n=1 Tax=Pseudomonas paraeruginosa TaxID=2994495 RepID=UPI0039FB9F7D
MRRLIFLLALICTGPATAGELLALVNDALAYDAGLAGGRASVEIGRLEVPRARSALLPRLEGGWGRAYNRIETEHVPSISYRQNGWTVSLTQPLFDWQRWIALKQAGTASARSRLEYAQAWQDLVLRTARSYFDALQAQDVLELSQGYLDAVQAQHSLVLHQHQGGEATLIDMREAQVRLDSARLQRRSARHALDSKLRELESLSGRPARLAPRNLASIPAPWLEPGSIEQWVHQAETKNYGVQLGQLKVRAAQDDAERTRAQRYPVVSLSGTHSPSGAASGYARPTTTTTAMLTVTVPLFTGGEIRTRVRQALASEDLARNELLEAMRQASSDSRESFENFIWARERNETLNDLVQARQTALAATRMGYLAGSRGNLDVLRAQEALHDSSKELVQAHHDMLTSYLSLKADAAALDLGDIARLDHWLANDAH